MIEPFPVCQICPKRNLIIQFQVAAAHVPSEREGKVIEVEGKKQFCPLCPHKLGCVVKYTVSTAYKRPLSFYRVFCFRRMMITSCLSTGCFGHKSICKARW